MLPYCYFNSVFALNMLCESIELSKVIFFAGSLLLSNFFTKGWGKPEDLKSIFEFRRRLAKRSEALTYVNKTHPITITKDEKQSDHRRIEGMHLIIFIPTFLFRILVDDIDYIVQIRVMNMQSKEHDIFLDACLLQI
jgi:hypothetical protein